MLEKYFISKRIFQASHFVANRLIKFLSSALDRRISATGVRKSFKRRPKKALARQQVEANRKQKQLTEPQVGKRKIDRERQARSKVGPFMHKYINIYVHTHTPDCSQTFLETYDVSVLFVCVCCCFSSDR